MGRYGGWDFRLVLWTVGLVCLCILVVPLAFVVLSSFRGPATYLPIEPGTRWTLENFLTFYGDKSLYTRVLPDTLLLAVSTLVIACAVACVLAWHIEREPFRYRIVARMLVLAPMAIPPTAMALAWITLLGPNAGWINVGWRAIVGSTSGSGPFNIFSFGGLIWCQAIAAVPVAYLLLTPAVKALRKDAEEAAYVAGATPARVLWYIHLPSALQSFLGPLLILLLVALEQVDYPYILGPTAGVQVLGTKMLYELTSPSGLPNLGGASAAAMLMVVLAVGGLAIHDSLTQTRAAATASPRVVENVNGRAGRWTWLCMTLLVGYIGMGLVVPTTVLASLSLDVGSGGGGQALLSFVADDRFGKALVNTLVVAASSAVTGTLIGLAIAICSYRRNDRLGRMLNRLSMTSVALPPVSVAFGLSVLFLTLPVGIYGTLFMLVIAYSYRVALATRLTSGALSQLGTAIEESAATSGIRWIWTQVAIVVPLIWPSILASMAFLFVVGVKEFTIPLMLYSPDNALLSVLVLQLTQSGSTAAGAASGLLVMGMGLLGIGALAIADRAQEHRRTP